MGDYIRINDISFRLDKIKGVTREDNKLYISYVTYRWNTETFEMIYENNEEAVLDYEQLIGKLEIYFKNVSDVFF